MGNEEVDLVTVAKPANKKSLLERYDIPIEHLSYEYITESNDAKELERIVLILRSGEEGSYPDLTKHAEKRLAEIKPESTVLRVSEPVLTRDMLAPERRQKLENDMNQWMNEMKLREKDLEEGRSLQISEPVPQPDIRKITFSDNKKKQQPLKNQNKNKRISACDYTAWDKYDADTELNRIDLQNEIKQADNKRNQQKLREKEEKVKKTSRKAIVNNLNLTGTEYNVMAEEERKKGNEAFKAGDYEEALQFYDLSIAIDASIQAYNNRAITFIKLRRYSDAVNDCNRVISAEHTNIKALLRRALALEHLEKNGQALADYEAVLKLEPTSKVAITAIKKLRAPCNSRKITMKIEEETNNDEENLTKTSEMQKIDNNNFQQAKSKFGHEKSREKGITHVNEPLTTSNRFTTVSSDNSTSSATSSHRKQPQVCFCNNAPSSSQHISPLPHMRDIYCSKNVEKSSGSPKLQSIFTNAKMPSGKSSGVIIEEIPNEEYEKPVEKSNSIKSSDRVTKKIEEKKILGSGDTPNNVNKNSSKFIQGNPKKEDITKSLKFDKKSSGVIIEEIPNEEYEKPVEKSNTKKSNDRATKKIEEKNMNTILGSGDTPNNVNKKSSKFIEGNPKKEDMTKSFKFDKKSSGVIIEEIPNEECEKPVEKSNRKKSNDRATKNMETILGSGDTPNNIAKKSSNLMEENPKKEAKLTEDIPKSLKFDEKSSGVIIEEIPNEEYEKPVEKSNSKKSNDRATKKPEEKNVETILGSGDTPNNIAKKSSNLMEGNPKKEDKLKEDITKSLKFDKISTPYEFLKVWHSLKNDSELILRAKLLLSLRPENIDTVIGNKLDGDMLSIILKCFERHFCIPEESEMLHRFLHSLTTVKRFSMICMFMNEEDKKVMRKILQFLEVQGSDSETIQNIYKAYGISM